MRFVCLRRRHIIAAFAISNVLQERWMNRQARRKNIKPDQRQTELENRKNRKQTIITGVCSIWFALFWLGLVYLVARLICLAHISPFPCRIFCFFAACFARISSDHFLFLSLL